MAALTEKQVRNASIALAAIALILLMVLMAQKQGLFAPVQTSGLQGKGTDSPLALAPVKNHRIGTAFVSSATAPVEGEGEIITREEFEADLRALQQTQQ